MVSASNSANVVPSRTAGVCGRIGFLRRSRLLVIQAVAALALIGAEDAVLADQLSLEDRVGIERFEGVWDVRPMRALLGRGGRPPVPPRNAGAASGGPNLEGLDMGDRRVYQLMTPQGRAAFEKMDPRELPTNNCLSAGVPTLAAVPSSQDWSFERGLYIAPSKAW